MIATCNAAGVEIIADSVINHTTGADQGKGTGVAGSKYDGEGNFPAIPYTKENFHDCTKNIGDYTNADEVQNCRLTSLQDLDTSQEYVQDRLAEYMNHLLDLGVYGFRVDAVKHIATDDVAAIKDKLAEKSGRNADDIFFEQEVIGNSSEAAAIQPSNYLANGKVTEFNFTNHLSVAFAGDITDESKGLSKVGGDGWVSSDKAAVWVTTGILSAARPSPTRRARSTCLRTRSCSRTTTASRTSIPATTSTTPTTALPAPPKPPCPTWSARPAAR